MRTRTRPQGDALEPTPFSGVVAFVSDVPWALVAYLLLLFVIPAQFVLPGFGAAGAPASLVGLALLGLLVLTALHGEPNRIQWSPVTIGVCAYFTVGIAGYVNAHTRALSTLAASTSDRALISLTSLVGVALFVASRVRSVRSINRVIDVMIAASLVMCVVGLVQFFFGVNLAASLKIPGLVANTAPREEIAQRSIFNRPFGTALHPIEFGVVTAGIVPVALVRAIVERKRWLSGAVLILAFSAMASISRSAVLALGIMFVVLLAGMGWRQRGNLAIGGLVFVVFAGSIVPGLVGTLRSLFTNTDVDPSVQARIERTPEVLRLISENTWFGRGYGTFTPSEYLLLDNEVQKLGIEIGVIGVAVLALWLLSMILTAVRIGQDDPEHKLLAYGLLASVLCIFASSYTFDAFFYHILSGVLYVNLGLLSVLWNQRHSDPLRRPSPRAERPQSSRSDHGHRRADPGVPAEHPRSEDSPRYRPSVLSGLGLPGRRPGTESLPPPETAHSETPPHGLFGADWPEILRDDPPSSGSHRWPDPEGPPATDPT